jgi:DNA invertase Pin-like site-specific DNA recombinase
MGDQGGRQAILYAAKSTEDIRGSIPGQLEDGRHFAQSNGLEVIAEYSEADVSAYKGNRGPELAAALEHVQRIGGTLVVQHSDRLARGDGRQARHLVEIALWARRTGVRIHCIQDPSTFENLVLAAAMGERNMEDSRRKSAAVAAGIARRRATGRFLGAPSFGFRLERDEHDERVLVEDPEQAPVVKRIYAQYLAGTSQFQIARALNRDGVPTQRGGPWKSEVIRSILTNPLHAGLIRDNGILIEGRHRGIVPRVQWEEAQALRQRSALSAQRGRQSIGRHLFRKGQLRCGACGQSMIIRTERNADGTKRETYRCYGHYLDLEVCSVSPQPRQLIDDVVYAYFRELSFEINASRRRFSEALERRIDELEGQLATLDSAVELAESRIAQIKEDYLSGDLQVREWRALRQELEPKTTALLGKREYAAAQLREAGDLLGSGSADQDLHDRLAAVATAIAAGVEDRAGVEAVRSRLLAVFDRFEFHYAKDTEGASWIEPIIGAPPQPASKGPRADTVVKPNGSAPREDWIWAKLLGPIPIDPPD